MRGSLHVVWNRALELWRRERVVPVLVLRELRPVDEVGLDVGPHHLARAHDQRLEGSVTLWRLSSMYAGSKPGTFFELRVDELVEDQNS